MVTEIYSSVTTSISELKKNPIKAASHDVVCVLNRCKPAFYTVTPERMAELLDTKSKLDEINEANTDLIQIINDMHSKGLLPYAIYSEIHDNIR